MAKKKTVTKSKTKGTKSIEKNNKVTYVKICPNCGSIEIKHEKSKDVPETFVCQKCKYQSIIFPEVDKDKSIYFKEHIIHHRHHNTLRDIFYGHYEPSIIVKISGPVMFFIGILLLLMLKSFYVPVIYPLFIIIIGVILSYVGFIGGRN